MPVALFFQTCYDYVRLDDVAAALMHVALTTAIGLRNANNVEHVAGGMSNSGDECLDGDRGKKGRAWLCLAAGGRFFPRRVLFCH